MPLPRVDITIGNGGLGQAPQTNDGMAGLAYSGAAVPGKIGLADPKLVFGLESLAALGIDQAYDDENGTQVYRQCRQFWEQAGDGAPLWLMLYSPGSTMYSVCDPQTGALRKMLDEADGEIRLAGIGRVPPESYAPNLDNGLDGDVFSALPRLQATAEAYAAGHMPFRAVVDGRQYGGDPSRLLDLRTTGNNRVAVLAATVDAGSLNASVGLLLGRLARIPVQRSPGRVRDGELGVQGAWMSDGVTEIAKMPAGAQDLAYDRAYVSLRKFPRRSGFFFTGGKTATADGDDYNRLSRGRVVDKAASIVHDYYAEFIQDEIETGDDGFVDPSAMAIWQEGANDQLQTGLVGPGHASGARVAINPAQNVARDKQLKAVVAVRPKGLAEDIIINLGFANPTDN